MFRRKKLFAIGATIIVLMLIGAGSAVAGEEPEILFEFKTEEKVEDVSIIGENEDYILVTSKDRIWVYDSHTGKELWQDKVPGHTGMKLTWGQKYYIASMKKGMRCYELASGKLVWETETPLQMKEYSQYFNFSTGFVLCFGSKLMGFEPNTGEVKWTSEKLDWHDKMNEEGIPVIYEFDRDFGARFLVLGNKVTQLLDAATGDILGTVELKYDHKNPESVAEIGGYGIALFGKNEAKSMDLRTGKQLWAVEEKVDRKRGYHTFDHAGKHYALLNLKKTLMVLDLDAGKKLWQTPEEMVMKLQTVHLYDDGLLLAVGVKNFHTPRNEYGSRGGYTLALGLDFTTGALKYKSLLSYSAEPTVDIPLLGFVWQSIVKGYYDHPEGALFLCYANGGKQIGEMGKKWGAKGGEGFVLMDPKTGKVKWRNNFVIWEHWKKPLGQASDYKDWKGAKGGMPGEFETLGEIPPIIIQDGYGYINANNTIVKVDLMTGQTVWEGPQLGFASHFYVSEGRVFGEVGYSRWTYETEGQKAKDVVFKSKENGYFVLDEATGKEMLKVEKLKQPIDLFLHAPLEGQGVLLLCDGLSLRCLDLAKGKYAWELDLKEGLTGEIGAKEGVVFVLTAVSSSTSYGIYKRTITTTKSYNISMEHGVFGLPGGELLVIAKKGPAVVGLDGKVKWQKEWEWKRDKINFVPHVTDRGIIYQYNKKMSYISLKDGSIIWETKEKAAKDTDIFLDEGRKRIFIIEEKNVSAYKL